MKKLMGFLVAAGLLLGMSFGFAANLSLTTITGACSEASQLQNCVNTLTNNINSRVSGVATTVSATAVTTGTAIQTLATIGLPAGTLANSDDVIRIRAWGVNSADANAKTLTIAWGAGSTLVLTVTGSANQWDSEAIIYRTGASTQFGIARGVTGTTVVAPVSFTNGAETDTAVIPILIRGTAATAGTMTLNGAIVETLH